MDNEEVSEEESKPVLSAEEVKILNDWIRDHLAEASREWQKLNREANDDSLPDSRKHGNDGE